MQTSLTKHVIIALAVSYGLSVFFWLGLGVFNLGGFIVISALVAVTGVAGGWLLGKRLVVTALITLVLRVLVYLGMTGKFAS